MYKILKNEEISKNIYLMEVESKLIASHFVPGEFIIVMSSENSERVPLTIYDINNNIIKIVYQVVGASTLELSKNKDSLFALTGPLGNPGLFLENIDKNLVYVAGGVGIAAVYPQLKYLHDKGIKTSLIYGARSKDNLILLDELSKIVDNLIITTEDGSCGITGSVLDAYKNVMNEYDLSILIGPVKMMEILTNISSIPTIVSLNPIMIDGTGMCGACRVLVNNEVKFACTDGPEFYGKDVDFVSLIKRMEMYKTEEGRNYLKIIEGSSFKGGHHE